MIPHTIQFLAADTRMEIRILRNIRVDAQILRCQACYHLHRDNVFPCREQRILHKVAEQILVAVILDSVRGANQVIVRRPVA